MWASEKEHLYFLADEISRLEEEVINQRMAGWLGGFFAGIGFMILMWLLHR